MLPIEDFAEGGIREDLLDIKRFLSPRSEWPASTPQSRVHASDAEWHKLAQVGLERGIFCEVREERTCTGVRTARNLPLDSTPASRTQPPSAML